MRQRHGAVSEHLDSPSSKHIYTVTKKDLPLHCPMPDMYLWNGHPKVYIPIEATGEEVCPYCGVIYRLVDDDAGR